VTTTDAPEAIRFLCPVCGALMFQSRTGATLAKNGPIYVCPVAVAEVTKDSRGHLKRKRGAKHSTTRSWTPDELLYR